MENGTILAHEGGLFIKARRASRLSWITKGYEQWFEVWGDGTYGPTTEWKGSFSRYGDALTYLVEHKRESEPDVEEPLADCPLPVCR